MARRMGSLAEEHSDTDILAVVATTSAPCAIPGSGSENKVGDDGAVGAAATPADVGIEACLSRGSEVRD